MTIAIGQKFRLLKDFGNQAFDPIGARHGLAAGSVGTLVLEVPAHEVGAHNNFEDAYVLEFEDETRTVAPDGTLAVGKHMRRVSFAQHLFHDDAEVRAKAEQMQDHIKGVGTIPADPSYNDGPLFELVK